MGHAHAGAGDPAITKPVAGEKKERYFPNGACGEDAHNAQKTEVNMSYQFGYSEARPARHGIDLLVKAGSLLIGATVAAIMGAHLLHKYSPPARTAPISQIVAYYSQGTGAVGGSGHWMMEASENTTQWRAAVRYCQAQAAAQDANWSGGNDTPKMPKGCGVINTLAQSGY